MFYFISKKNNLTTKVVQYNIECKVVSKKCIFSDDKNRHYTNEMESIGYFYSFYLFFADRL